MPKIIVAVYISKSANRNKFQQNGFSKKRSATFVLQSPGLKLRGASQNFVDGKKILQNGSSKNGSATFVLQSPGLKLWGVPLNFRRAKILSKTDFQKKGVQLLYCKVLD
jgi:hypothetical protein